MEQHMQKPCLICGGQRTPWRGPASGFVRCRHCGVVARDPMPTESELDARYAALYAEERIACGETAMESPSVALDNHARYIARELLGPGMKVLDFGASTGALLMRLRRHGLTVDGLETSEAARRTAESKTGAAFFLHPSELAPESYDAVVMVEVIEHLVDPAGTLRAIRASLKPGGLLYICTPNLGGLLARLSGPRWREAQLNVHLMLFDFASLHTLLRSCGFGGASELRYSPLTSASPLKCAVHRVLQFAGLYGGLRVVAMRDEDAPATKRGLKDGDIYRPDSDVGAVGRRGASGGSRSTTS